MPAAESSVNRVGMTPVKDIRTIKPVTLRDQVFDEIQRAILEKQLKPGDHIREQELTESLQVSRTPVREALALLERDGLVTISRNRGCFVRRFDEVDIREIFEMRTALENFAASLIIDCIQAHDFDYLEQLVLRQIELVAQPDRPEVSRLDLDFHKYIVRLAGNSRILRTWQIIAMQYTLLFSYFDGELLQANKQLMLDSHHEILAALRSRDLAQVSEVNQRVNRQVAQHCIDCYRLQVQENGHR